MKKMKKLKLMQAKSPSERIAYVLAIFIIIAILLTFQKVAEIASELVSSITGGKVTIPVPLMQSTAANLAMIGAGLVLFGIGAIIAIPVIKFTVIVVGLLMVGIALRNVYRTFTGKPGETPLPNDLIRGK